MTFDIESFIEKGKLFDNRYKLLRPLSSDGGTADVWLALDANTIDEVYDEAEDDVVRQEESGIQVAIKIYRPKNAMDIGEQRFRDEFKIVFNCHHTNLVQPINFSIYEGIPYLVLPFCANGSSEKLQGKVHDADELWRYISDVSAGLNYLHSVNPTIVHHDIKPANILIDDGGNFVITDFGISSHSGNNRDGYEDSQSGTMAYMAPERFGEDYESSPESDIWSFGATVYELITGEVPFGENGGGTQAENNAEPPKIEENVPKYIKRLVYDCLSLEPAKRPSAQTIYRAAQSRKYPLWSTRKKAIVSGGVCAVLAALVFCLIPTEEKKPSPKPISIEERYSQALSMLDSKEKTTMERGLALLDSLSSKGYVPATYELAHTYGWYSDSVSLMRKSVLGIEVYPDNTVDKYLPKSYTINNRAIGLLARIEEANDSSYTCINAEALYRLACYYFNTDKVVSQNTRRAEKLLKKAYAWAELCDDRVLMDKIANGLKAVDGKK